jgi:hypothetical protein
MPSTLTAGNATNSGVNLTGAIDGALEIKTGSGAGTTAVTVSTGQVVTLANALPIASGGTGGTTAVTAFDALSPATTKGDLIVSNGTDNVRQAVGTDTHVLTADSTTATGVKWAAAGGGGGGFPSGTVMLFVQTAAPTGWTKSTTHNDKALRIVSGTASTGGSVAFTTAFASGLNAGNTTLSTTQMPSHTHSTNIGGFNPCTGGGAGATSGDGNLISTSATGGGGSHNHTIPSFAVSYVDVIIATAN